MAGRSNRGLPPLVLAAALLAVAALPDPSVPGPAAPPPDPPAPTARAAPPPRLVTVALPPPLGREDRSPGPAAAPVPAAPAGPVVRPTAADAGRGAVVLDRLAAGAGPAVEIAWPPDPAARRLLRQHLARCAGWQPLLLAGGRLWRLGDPAGRPWMPAPADAPSGLLRDLDGPAADSTLADAVRARHRLVGGRPVAAVARDWDARLLGGLDRLAGAGKGGIRAGYAIAGDRLWVVDIQVGGRGVPGRVDLGPVSRCGS